MKNHLYSTFLFIGSAFLSFFAPISLIIHVITFVILLDCFTAIMKTWKQYKPVSKNWFYKLIEYFRVVRSRKLKKTVLKFFLYLLFIMAIYAAEIAIFNQCLYITNFAAFVIIFSELVSVAENLDILLVTNKFTTLIKRIRKIFEKKIIDQISSDEPDSPLKNTDDTNNNPTTL